MDNRQVQEDLSNFNLEELLNLSFDLDSSNSIDETANHWLDELISSIASENTELSAASKEMLQEYRTADAHTETVEVSKESRSNHVEVVTVRDAVQHNTPLSQQPVVDIRTENFASALPRVQSTQWIMKISKQKIDLSKKKLSVLEREFEVCHYPDRYTRKKLASQLKLTQMKVSEWFTNQRIKMKKQSFFDFELTLNTSSGQNGRSKRIAFSTYQLELLEREFENCQNPDSLVRQKLALILGLRVAQVNNWFQNRRSKMRKLRGHYQSPPMHNELATSTVSEKFFQIKDLDNNSNVNNNRLVLIEPNLQKYKSRDDPALIHNVTNKKFEEMASETCNLLSSAKSNEDLKENSVEKLFQIVISRTKRSGGPSEQKRKRTCYSKSQLDLLEHEFKNCKYPDSDTICRLASIIKVTKDQVNNWFRNQRAKQKNLEKYAQVVQVQTDTPSHLPTSISSTKKSKRTGFRKRQIVALERKFKNCQYPNLITIYRLAFKMNLRMTQVRRWFSLRRAKQHMLEKTGQILRAQEKKLGLFLLPGYSKQKSRFENRLKMRKLKKYIQLLTPKTSSSPSNGFCAQTFSSRRTDFNECHLAILENEFKRCQYPKQGTLTYLALIINASYNEIRSWFRNRRSKERNFDKLLPAEISKPRRRAKKTNFNASQLDILEHQFSQCHYLDYDTTCYLAKTINVSYEIVRTWFVNRRAKLRQLNKKCQILKLQTETTSFSSSSQFHLIEAQPCSEQMPRFQNSNQSPTVRTDDGIFGFPSSVQQMRVSPENLQLECYNSNTSSVFIQQSYCMTTLPPIQMNEFYNNPAPPCPQCVFSHIYNAPVNRQNFIV